MKNGRFFFTQLPVAPGPVDLLVNNFEGAQFAFEM